MLSGAQRTTGGLFLSTQDNDARTMLQPQQQQQLDMFPCSINTATTEIIEADDTMMVIVSPKDAVSVAHAWPVASAPSAPAASTSPLHGLAASSSNSMHLTSAPNSASLPPSPVPSPGPSRAFHMARNVMHARQNGTSPSKLSQSSTTTTTTNAQAMQPMQPMPQRTSPYNAYHHPAAAAFYQQHQPPFHPQQQFLPPFNQHQAAFAQHTQLYPQVTTASQTISSSLSGAVSAPSTPQLLQTLTEMDTAARFELLSAWIDQSATDTKDLQVLSHLIKPKLRTDVISLLPYEIVFQILSYLPTPSLLRAACVSKKWNLRCQDDLLWRRMCLMEKVNTTISPSIDPMTGNNRSTVVNLRNLREHQACSVSARQFYRRHYITQHNWSMSSPVLHSFLSPASGVITSMQFNEDVIVAGLDVRGVGTIHVFGTSSGKWLRTLTGHEGGVWCLQFKGDLLVSGGCDRDIRVWNLSTGECKLRLSGHTSTVRCLQLMSLDGRPNCALSGSRDGTQRLWDLDSGECLHVLRGHSASVRCVAVYGKMAVSGSYDGTARVWDLETGECKTVLNGHTAQVYSVVFSGKYICTGALDTTVHVWNPDSGECIAVLQGHDALVGHLQLEGDTLITGGSDGRICMWNLPSLSCLHKIHAHPTAVTTLHYDPQGERLVTGGDDGVKIWNSETGQLSRTVTEQVSSVWRVGCDHRRLVSAFQRGEGTIVEVMDFGVDL